MTETEPDSPDDEPDDKTQEYCGECGSPVDPGEQFCTDCGAAVDATDESGLDEPLAAASQTDELARSPRQKQSDDTIDKDTIVGYLFWGAFGALVLLVAVTLFGFYTSTLRFINVWITDEYQPLVLALFNLSMLLVGLTGLSLLVRRLGEPEPGDAVEDA